MVNVNDLVAVFPADGALAFVIDAIQFTISPDRLPAGLTRRSRPSRPVQDRLKGEGRLVWPGGKRIASFGDEFRDEGFTQVHQALGEGNFSCTFKTNVQRRTRQRLIATGRYRDRIAVPEARPDNFLDESGFLGAVDPHEECLLDLCALLGEVRRIYGEVFAEVFGVAPGESTTTITQIELTWDRRCGVAQAAPTLWWPSWRDTFVGAGIGPVEAEEDRPTAWIRGTTEYREVYAARGPAVLHALDVRGDRAKLYAKHYKLLRYEAQLTRERMYEVLGRPLRLDSAESLRADLETLAAPRYARLLAAQKSLTVTGVLNLPALLHVLADAGEPRKVFPILEALWAGSTFHNRDERHSKELGRLVAAGAAVRIGKGQYAPGPLLTRTLHLAQFFARHSEEAP
jgi:hypothetical protein